MIIIVANVLQITSDGRIVSEGNFQRNKILKEHKIYTKHKLAETVVVSSSSDVEVSLYKSLVV